MTRLALLVLVAACGSKSTPEAKVEHEDHHEEKMAPELAKFHDVLAPRWHADKGAQRMKDTCAALPDFHAQADALASMAPPAGSHAEMWTAGTKQLVGAVAGLDAPCKANDATAFEGAFHQVHQSFHGLLAAAGGEQEGHRHDEHGADEAHDHKM